MSSLLRYSVPAFFIAVFLLLATVALDKPGYYYDEVIFVPVSLRVLGHCDVDAAVSLSAGCLPLLQTLGYVGAVKAWVHAPLFALFGTSIWTVRLPAILFGAAALFVLWSFTRRELGSAWAALLVALLATDPVLISHARLDWGPHMIAAFLRVLSLVALWRWLQTGRAHWLVVVCAAFLIGFVDKINFIWVIAAWTAAALLVGSRLVVSRLRDGAPWQPAIAAVTALLLLAGLVTMVRNAAQLDILGDAGTLSFTAQIAKVWNLFAATFSGTSMLNWVFGIDVPITSAFNILALLQFGTAVVLLARWRPWTPARRLLAFLTAASAFLVLVIAATRQVGGTHHLVAIWPLPALHFVTLLAIASQHAAGPTQGAGRGFRAAVATTGAVVFGALLAWNITMNHPLRRHVAERPRLPSRVRPGDRQAVDPARGARPRPRDLGGLGIAPAARHAGGPPARRDLPRVELAADRRARPRARRPPARRRRAPAGQARGVRAARAPLHGVHRRPRTARPPARPRPPVPAHRGDVRQRRRPATVHDHRRRLSGMRRDGAAIGARP